MALVAHMREVDAAVLAGDRRQRDEFLGARVDGGRIDEGSGHAHGPVLHSLAHQRPHLLELFRRRGDVLVAQHHAPHLRQSYVVHHVDGNAEALEDRKILRVPPPAQRVAIDDGRTLLGFGALGSGRAALAGKVGGDALAQLALGARRVGDEHQAGLAHHVDEAGRNHAVARVDGPGGLMPGEAPHGGDAVSAHPHVGAEPGVAGSVHDPCVDDEDVEGRVPLDGPRVVSLHASARRGAEKCREQRSGDPACPGSLAVAAACFHRMDSGSIA